MMSLLAEPLDFETKVAFDIASQESLSEIPCLEPFFLANLKFRFFLLGGEQTCEKIAHTKFPDGLFSKYRNLVGGFNLSEKY